VPYFTALTHPDGAIRKSAGSPKGPPRPFAGRNGRAPCRASRPQGLEATGAPPKSLIRMFGPRGNPQAKNLFNVIGYLQKRAGLSLYVAG